MADYKVSIIIPVYNAESTIEKCIKSALDQNMDSIEYVIINDGSTDGTSKLLMPYQNRTEIKIITKKNEGVSIARNTGIKAASGEYLFFLDSDDWIDSNTICTMYNFAKTYNLDLVSCSHIEKNTTLYGGNINNADSFIACTNKDIGKSIFCMYPKSACAKLFRKTIIDKNYLFFPEKMNLGEDMFFTFNFLINVTRIGKVDNVFYHIENVNPVSLSKRYVPNIGIDLEEQLTLWNKLFSHYEEARIQFYKEHMSVSLTALSIYANNLQKKDCFLDKKVKNEMLKKYINLHADWLNAKNIEKPKNNWEKIIYFIMKTQNVYIINCFFRLKEYVKWKKLRKNYIRE